MAQSASVPSSPSRRGRRKRVATICWRWTLVLLGASGAAWLIFVVIQGGAWLPIQLPTTGIAIAAAGAFAGDLMALFVSCSHYVRGEKYVSLGSLTPSFWKAWGTCTAIIIAVLAFVQPQEILVPVAPPAAAVPVVSEPEPATLMPPAVPDASPPWLVVYAPQPAPVATPRLSTIPVFFRNNAAPETARHRRTSVVAGVSFTPEELDVSIEGLRRLIAALGACGAVPGGPPTEIEIAGYASSKEFTDPVAGSAQADSDLRNAQIANRRARAAFCFVNSQAPSVLANASDWEGHEDGPECPADRKYVAPDAQVAPLRITVRRWMESESGYKEMVEARKFLDRPPGVAQVSHTDPEELNRRVDIHVVSAGACSAPVPQGAVQMAAGAADLQAMN